MRMPWSKAATATKDPPSDSDRAIADLERDVADARRALDDFSRALARVLTPQEDHGGD